MTPMFPKHLRVLEAKLFTLRISSRCHSSHTWSVRFSRSDRERPYLVVGIRTRPMYAMVCPILQTGYWSRWRWHHCSWFKRFIQCLTLSNNTHKQCFALQGSPSGLLIWRHGGGFTSWRDLCSWCLCILGCLRTFLASQNPSKALASQSNCFSHIIVFDMLSYMRHVFKSHRFYLGFRFMCGAVHLVPMDNVRS